MQLFNQGEATPQLLEHSITSSGLVMNTLYQDNAGLCLWTHGFIWLGYLLECFVLVWLITTLIIFEHHYWSKMSTV